MAYALVNCFAVWSQQRNRNTLAEEAFLWFSDVVCKRRYVDFLLSETSIKLGINIPGLGPHKTPSIPRFLKLSFAGADKPIGTNIGIISTGNTSSVPQSNPVPSTISTSMFPVSVGKGEIFIAQAIV
ncbi:hypothetical protein CEXT_278231 [Caerostris extrusa]|uniref:Uncharacterized protein n=1 Tax=Caerostris extrusa TaxID=172846 RepID=A0AAV4W0M5_CAEEX|nr:hypothetical protein CEXT_278231 [Caerostris extrusa]